jgi:HAD superfamily hydrolase (TIGR01509 family)
MNAFFFDMDGTLFDSMPQHAQCWEDAMRYYGFEFQRRDVYLNEGRTGQDVIDELFVKYRHRHATQQEIEEVYHRKTHLFEVQPEPPAVHGVKELLEHLKKAGKQIFVVTGSGQKSLLNRLNYHFPGIFAPERMITAFDYQHGKPDPEPYLKAIEKAGITPDQGMVIENAPLGCMSGHRAGLFTVGINTGILTKEELTTAGADIAFDTMDDFHNYLIDNGTLTL